MISVIRTNMLSNCVSLSTFCQKELFKLYCLRWEHRNIEDDKA